MSINLNQTYHSDRNNEYVKDLKDCIENNYNVSVISIEKAKRGYMAETYLILTKNKKLFAKIVSLKSHKNIYKNSFKVVEFLNKNGVDFILKNIKTKNNKLTCDFKNNVLGLFEFIEGEHSENYSLNLLFEKYSFIYQVSTNGLDIKRENFGSSILIDFKINLFKIRKNKKIINFLKSKKEIIKSYEERLKKIGKECRKDLNDFYLTHGDAQGNIMVLENNIKIVDWDTPLLSPIERDAWIFLDNEKTLGEFSQILDKNNIKYKFKKERLYYYCYFYFFYYLNQNIEIILNLKNEEKINEVFEGTKDLFSNSNWLQKRILVINKDLEKDIPDYNIFMICHKLNKDAFREDLPKGYSIRNCRKDEFDVWKKFPFDNEIEAKEYNGFMEDYFGKHYKDQEELFFSRCKFICNEKDDPVSTGFIWKHYNKYTTVNWIKTLKKEEGKGLGRVLLTSILKSVKEEDYPIFLHTQPGSFKAIKLYSDFGFKLIKSPKIIDKRENDPNQYLPILKEFMFRKDYNNLKFHDYKNKK